MKWSQLIKAFFQRFPQWAVSMFIILGGSLAFLCWWIHWRFSQIPQAPAAQVAPPIQFQPAEVILCGNSLVDRHSGKVLAREWLQGLGATVPPIAKIIPEEKLVIVAANNGAVGAFDMDGRPKALLQSEDKPVAFAAFDRDFRQVVFVRDGNLWCGLTDWAAGAILAPKKFTNTGYFRDDLFRAPWLWHEGDLLVSVMGKTLEVKFDGSVKETPVKLHELRHGMSPDGSFAFVEAGGSELGVLDLLNGEWRKFPVDQHMRKLLWLTPKKAVVWIGRDLLAQYDHSTGRWDRPQPIEGGIRDILEPSPNGSCFLVASANSVLIVDLGARKHAELKIQFDELDWVTDEVLLCSSSAVDTDVRGLWLVKKSGESEKISNQPMDGMRSPSAPPLVRVDGSAYFVAGGNLWFFETTGKRLKQITHGEKLPSQLQLLTH